MSRYRSSIACFCDDRLIDQRDFLFAMPDQLVIGRHPRDGYRLPRNNLSRNHMLARLMEDGLMLSDLESTNGTYVNGERLDNERLISHLDVVSTSNLTFRFRLVPCARPERDALPLDAQIEWVRELVHSDTLVVDEGLAARAPHALGREARAYVQRELLASSPVAEVFCAAEFDTPIWTRTPTGWYAGPDFAAHSIEPSRLTRLEDRRHEFLYRLRELRDGVWVVYQRVTLEEALHAFEVWQVSGEAPEGVRDRQAGMDAIYRRIIAAREVSSE